MILPFLYIIFLILYIFVLEMKKDETAVFKVNCQTCIDKIQKLVLEFGGEMNFSADKQEDWVTVNGIRDDIERLRKILNSPVEIVPFRKDKEGEKKKDEKGSVTTTVFRFPVHCDRCIDHIQKMVLNFEGVTNVSMDMEKDLVIVNGTMDVKALTEHLGEILMRKDKNDEEKGLVAMIFEVPQFLRVGVGATDMSALTDYIRGRLKRHVEVVPPEKDNGGSDDGDSDGDGDKNKKNEGEKTMMTVFKVQIHSQGCVREIGKAVSNFEGVTDVLVDRQKNLVFVKGTMDNIALRYFLTKRLRRTVMILSWAWRFNEFDNGSDGSDDEDGDDDSSGSGGDKNKKKGNGGDGDSDGDDGDKGEEGGGGDSDGDDCGKMKGFKMEYKGESGFSYEYGYHAGFENAYPVGQLHVAQMSNSDNLNGKEYRQSNEIGNGNAHGSGIKDNNNGDGGGKMKGIKMNYMGQLSRLYGGGQLHVAQMFCRESLNACSNIRSMVLV